MYAALWFAAFLLHSLENLVCVVAGYNSGCGDEAGWLAFALDTASFCVAQPLCVLVFAWLVATLTEGPARRLFVSALNRAAGRARDLPLPEDGVDEDGDAVEPAPPDADLQRSLAVLQVARLLHQSARWIAE